MSDVSYSMSFGPIYDLPENMDNSSEEGEAFPYSDNGTYIATAESQGTAHRMLFYGLPVIMVAGTLGNAASAAVLSRPRMRATSVYFYLLLLSAADTLVLYSSALKTWLRLATGTEWLHASDAACRSLTFTLLTAQHLSAWLIVLTTADRFVAVWFPLKVAVFCSKRRARLASLILFIAIIIFDGHVFWTFELLPEGKMNILMNVILDKFISLVQTMTRVYTRCRNATYRVAYVPSHVG